MKKGLIADLKMVEMSQVLKDTTFKDCWNIRLYAYSALPFDKCYPCWYWTNIQILDDLSENISLKSDLQLFLFGLGFVKKNMSKEISNWYQPKMSKDGFCNFVFHKYLFYLSENADCWANAGNKKRNIVFQKWRGTHYRKWPGSVRFQRKKNRSKRANIHFHRR